jgi:hypothetical protein
MSYTFRLQARMLPFEARRFPLSGGITEVRESSFFALSFHCGASITVDSNSFTTIMIEKMRNATVIRPYLKRIWFLLVCLGVIL